jgi:uncharacterized protein (DUF58 family)
MIDRFPRGFINHIELWLSAVALVLIFGIPAAVGPQGLQFWRLTAIIAIAVGTIHGVIFWVVRRRQRQIRRRSIQQIQQMLADVVKNRLTAIDMYLPEEDDPEMVRQEVDGIRTSIREIATHVDNLSEETLEDWEEKYEEALQQTAEVGAVSQS